MRSTASTAWWTIAALAALTVIGPLACGGAPPPPPPAPATKDRDEDAEQTSPDDAAAPPAPVAVDAPERSRPPSTATYEQAMSAPESLDVNDGRPHLDDDQLRGPMRAVMTGCPLPKNAKVTIHTAVQSGRAIGVTVDVRFEHPPPPPPPSPRTARTTPKRPSRAALQRAKLEAEREAKAKKKIAACVDRNVRMIVWPPSSRRDSFTTEF